MTAGAGLPYAPTHAIQAREDHARAADLWAERTSAARRVLDSRIAGLRMLLGDGVAAAIRDAWEHVSESAGEVDYHRGKDYDRTLADLRRDLETVRAQAHGESRRAREAEAALAGIRSKIIAADPVLLDLRTPAGALRWVLTLTTEPDPF